jgi:signal transduction histidine kinase
LRIRRKLFATFLAISLFPLLLLASLGYWNGVRNAESSLQTHQARQLENFVFQVNSSLAQAKREITSLSYSKPLLEFLDTRRRSNESPAMGPLMLEPEIPVDLRASLATHLSGRDYVHSLSIYDNQQKPLLAVRRGKPGAPEPVEFQTRDFLSNQPKPDSRAWSSSPGTQAGVVNSVAKATPAGPLTVFTAPVAIGNNQPLGSVVVEVLLDPIFTRASGDVQKISEADLLLVLDRSETILHHTNDAVKNQRVDVAMPFFVPISRQMISTESARGTYTSPNQQTYSAVHTHLPTLDVFVAHSSNQDAALAAARTNGKILVGLSLVMGLLSALAITLIWQKRSSGIERVSEGMEAIARGELDRQIDLRSRDDLRPLADNLGIVTKQLREQIAREAESRQFQSFVRLSAVLTHDLKNSIEALSLTVSNMERHFENPEFRADAMKTLRSATENLRALVARLSNPVNTLSGEHKRPQSIDLVPMLRRVVSRTGADGVHKLELNLSKPVYALVDVDRMDKVIENLVINAREAMGQNQGTLTVEAGNNSEGKPFFSVSDTGVGMSTKFIEERLFHPFATTKKRGVGLGLYTCREVVRANGGSIEVRSREGAGTTFVVVLPSPPSR